MKENQHPGPLDLNPVINPDDGWLELNENNEGENVFLSILPSTALRLAGKLQTVAWAHINAQFEE